MAVVQDRGLLNLLHHVEVGGTSHVSQRLSPLFISALPFQQQKELLALVDTLGYQSAKAQGYSIITSSDRFMKTQHRIYLYTEGAVVLGLLKVGETITQTITSISRCSASVSVEASTVCSTVHQNQHAAGLYTGRHLIH